jgi:uncharacterized phage protein gp47/JayE
MPFDRPQLSRLIDQGAAEFESRLPGILARARRSLVGVLNRVTAGGLSALYQYVEYLNRQVWADTCDVENLPRHGARWGVPRKEAAPATGSVSFTGITGTDVPAGTVVMRSDGTRFATVNPVTLVAGTATAEVTAEVAGQAGNAAIATVLQLESPIAGINSGVTAFTALAGGADIEDAEDWRARILARKRRVPQGGSLYDYEDWALEVPGVTRAWASRGEMGAGTVTVRFTRDEDVSPIPDAGEVATVQAHIDERRPVTADAFVVAPIGAPVDFTIQLTPNDAAVRAAVFAELLDVIRREGEPGGTLLITHLREAVSIAAGEENHIMTVPNADVAMTTGQLPMMGVITWLP